MLCTPHLSVAPMALSEMKPYWSFFWVVVTVSPAASIAAQ
jgi:hypothetical protein